MPSHHTSDPTVGPRPLPFHAALEILDNGKTLRELEAHHKEATAQVRRKGGKGVITITLTYEAAEDGINITPDVKVKLPAKPRNKTFVYATEDGKTYEDNPHQTELPFPSVIPQPQQRKAQ